MNRALNTMSAAMLLAGSVLVGCNKEDAVPSVPPKTDVPAGTMDHGATTKPAASMPAAMGGAMMDSAKAAMATGKEAVAKEAMGKLDDVTQLIKDKKYDMADGALKKLEENKAALPEAVQGKLPEVRKALDAAKLLGGAPKLPDVKIPEVPGLNK